jgi:AcrR family transcriptional regulator
VSGHYHGDVSQLPSAIAATLGLEGLRERKKRQMRQLISDTATEMFLERGFDDVRVTEVAERCGVSEKTVYNYFPTKESLLLDREQAMTVALRAAFGPGAPARSPTQAALEVLKGELELLRPNWDALHVGEPRFERFADLVENTPSLRAAQRDLMDRLVQVVAEAMADRAGVSPDDPEPQIAAAAILGLWRIQYQALRLYSGGSRGFEQVYEEVTSEVARAARLIDSGLWAFEVMVQGRGTQEQMRAAAEAAQNAGRQVAMALRQARDVWRQVQVQHRESHAGHGPGEAQPDRQRYEGQSDDPRSRRPRERPRGSVRHEVEEWKLAQRELKQRYIKAKRDQQQLLRERLRQQQEEARRRGRRPGHPG